MSVPVVSALFARFDDPILLGKSIGPTRGEGRRWGGVSFLSPSSLRQTSTIIANSTGFIWPDIPPLSNRELSLDVPMLMFPFALS